MFKVFDKPRLVVNDSRIGIDAIKLVQEFTNGFEYILINLEELPGYVCKGELYAASDGTTEAHDLFIQELDKLRNSGIETLVGETYELSEGALD